MKPEIQTISGLFVNFLDPKPETITIFDIAWHLAGINRFTGASKVLHNVAHHSVIISDWVAPQFALHGLLHDAHEAYVGDMSSPLKQLLPEYRVIADRMQRVIWEKFGMEPRDPEIVKYCDKVELVTEKRDIMTATDTDHWSGFDHIPPDPGKLVPWKPSKSRAEFLKRFVRLYHG